MLRALSALLCAVWIDGFRARSPTSKQEVEAGGPSLDPDNEEFEDWEIVETEDPSFEPEVGVQSTRRRCCGHRRRRYGTCSHDVKAKHRRRRQCDCNSIEFGERGSKVNVMGTELAYFRVGSTVANFSWIRGEQKNRTLSSNVYGSAKASASFVGTGYKAQVSAETGFEVNESLSWSWYAHQEIHFSNTVVREPVCYWQTHFQAYNGCNALVGDWAGSIQNDHSCPAYFSILYSHTF